MLGPVANDSTRAHVRLVWRRAGIGAAALLVTLAVGVMLAKVVMARVPQQRASIERLLKQHTGLDIRFAELHVGWGWRGAQAVLTDVELVDPRARRFRTTAPEIRVELDSWGLFRGGELSLGRVTLVSPLIDVDLDRVIAARTKSRGGRHVKARTPTASRSLDQRWIEQAVDALAVLPRGRINIEAATLNLRGGGTLENRTISVSRAVLRRDEDSALAYGTFLLPERLGKTLFVSLEARGVRSKPGNVDGKARFIARNVQLGAATGRDALDGLVTLDARATIAEGRLAAGSWQANLRRLAFFDRAPAASPLRFARADVAGAATRHGETLRAAIDELYVAPADGPGASTKLSLEVATDGRALVLRSPELSLAAAQLLAAAAVGGAPEAWPRELDMRTGRLRDLDLSWRADSLAAPRIRVSARAEDLHGELATLGFRLAGLHGELLASDGEWKFNLDSSAQVRFTSVPQASPEGAGHPTDYVGSLAGSIRVTQAQTGAMLILESVRSRSETLALDINGNVAVAARGPVDVVAKFAGWEAPAAHAFLARTAPEHPLVAALAAIRGGRIASGEINLVGVRDAVRGIVPDRKQLRATATVEDVSWRLRSDAELLNAARAQVSHVEGVTRVRVTGGRVGDVELVAANLDIPESGAARVRVTALARLESPQLAAALPVLSRLRASGDALVELESNAFDSASAATSWRGAVRVSEGRMTVAPNAPEFSALRGALRFADGRLRSSTLAADWLGGPVEITVPAQLIGRDTLAAPVAVRGTARVAALPKWLAIQADSRLRGEIAYTGNLALAGESQIQLFLESSLAGVESALPAPFAKRALRALPSTLALELDAAGVRAFELKTNRSTVARGTRTPSGFTTDIDVPGLKGVLKASRSESRALAIDLASVEAERLPSLVAVAQALRAVKRDAVVSVAAKDLLVAGTSLGSLRGTLRLGREDLRLEDIELAAQLRSGGASVTCGTQCRLEWRGEARADAALLRVAGLTALTDAVSLSSNGSLAWPATEAPSARALTGRVVINASEGSFARVDSSDDQRFARVLLSPATVGASAPELGIPVINRFDDWSVELVFAGGDVAVDRWQASGREGSLTASGVVSLIPRTYNLKIEWTPAPVLPEALARIADRPRLTAAWSALRARWQRTGEAQPKDAFAARASVSGPWDAPFVAVAN